MDTSSTPENPALSPENIELLSEIGLLLRDDLGIVIAMMLTYGIYFVICTVALYSVLSRPRRKTKSRYLLLSALLTTFLITSLYVSARTSTVFLRLKEVLIGRPGSSVYLEERMEGYGSKGWRNSAVKIQIVAFTDADAGFVFLINDALAAWRAIVIFRSTTKTRVVDLLLYFLMFCNCVLWITTVVFNSQIGPSQTFNSTVSSVLVDTTSALSMAVNTVATWMIGYTTYRYLRFESRSGIKLHSGRVLVFLTESGILYGILQISRLVLTLLITPSTPTFGPLYTGQGIWQFGGNVVAAMFTPLLILIVNHGYSIAETVHLTSDTHRHKDDDASSCPGCTGKQRTLEDGAPPKALGRGPGRGRGWKGSLSNIVFGPGRTHSTGTATVEEGSGGTGTVAGSGPRSYVDEK